MCAGLLELKHDQHPVYKLARSYGLVGSIDDLSVDIKDMAAYCTPLERLAIGILRFFTGWFGTTCGLMYCFFAIMFDGVEVTVGSVSYVKF